jgi:hypothetical protein
MAPWQCSHFTVASVEGRLLLLGVGMQLPELGYSRLLSQVLATHTEGKDKSRAPAEMPAGYVSAVAGGQMAAMPTPPPQG